jgi:hypothetical protein
VIQAARFEKRMSTDALVCLVCGSSGFLVDKISFFPFVLGVVLGTSVPSRVLDNIGVRYLFSNVLGSFSQAVSLKKAKFTPDDCGGLGMDDASSHED